ncbi:site-2 protease family protein [Myxococcus qinghaiensis]|uniref:site-2 protease family protein n=1 Tax=Myxococcus qinghaiensis TaxID=2906758 RepID=UPI0020A74DE9|nr:site-2 protease family protein [Myxococcus qinghaiensis]MCP3163738.1 site-2 protease family protein [Myxococcus qinghaiensis]
MHYALVLLALGALLALHELGHLVAARLLGVRVPRFVFGFGPPMASFRLGGTQFVVGAVPLGATVHIQGMNPHRADADEAVSFRAMGPLRRALIILAGPLANYLFALGVLFALYTSGTHVVVPLTVGTVRPGSEAARAQLLPGDRIDTVDGQPLRTWTEFVEKVAVGVGRTLELRVNRHGESRTVSVRPRADERGEGRIGVSQQYVYRSHAPGEALGHAFVHTMNLASEGVAMFARLVRGGQPHGGPTGPGALVRQESSDAASSGVDSVLRALVAASMALALLTLLPVPGLDGGRVLLLMIEVASGRKLPPRVETVAQTVGFLAISAVIVAVAAAEIRGAVPERFRWGTQSATATAPVTGTPSTPGTGAPAVTGSTTSPPGTGGIAAPVVAGPGGPMVPGVAGTGTPAVAGAGAPIPSGVTGASGAVAPAVTGASGAVAPAVAGAGAPVPPAVTGANGAVAPAVAGAGAPIPSGVTGASGAVAPAVAGTGAPIPPAMTGVSGAVAPAATGESGTALTGVVAPAATGAAGPSGPGGLMPAAGGTTPSSDAGTTGSVSPAITAPGGPSAPATIETNPPSTTKGGPGAPGTTAPQGQNAPGAATPGGSSAPAMSGKNVPPAASTAVGTTAPAPAPESPPRTGAPTSPGPAGPTPPATPSPSAPLPTGPAGASAPTSP